MVPWLPNPTLLIEGPLEASEVPMAVGSKVVAGVGLVLAE